MLILVHRSVISVIKAEASTVADRSDVNDETNASGQQHI